MTTINWSTTREESELIVRIVDRAVSVFGGDRMTWHMDVTATHANGNRLDLAGLLDAGLFDFAHDLGGIRRHIDRTTGVLGDCFLPRYTERA